MKVFVELAFSIDHKIRGDSWSNAETFSEVSVYIHNIVGGGRNNNRDGVLSKDNVKMFTLDRVNLQCSFSEFGGKKLFSLFLE